MKVYRRIKELVTMQGALKKAGRAVKEDDLSIINNAAIIEDRGRIIWLGPDKNLKSKLIELQAIQKAHIKANTDGNINAIGKSKTKTKSKTNTKAIAEAKFKVGAKSKAPVKSNFKIEEVFLDGLTVLPGFIDAHTHLVFAGQRYDEFELRNTGVSYQEIAARGGGILSTMRATRAIGKQKLLGLAQNRVEEFFRQGVTTLEVKSGYSLNLEDEIKQLQVISKLQGPDCVSTFLGAHALPPEFSRYEDYLFFLSEKVLPIIKKKKLAKRVDIYIEKGFFPLVESRSYLEKAKALGFDLVIHADQLSLSGGAQLAVELGAKSADHVIHLSDQEIKALGSSEVTALLLPAADLYMKCNYPPARALIEAGSRVALATDFNPGSSPTQDLMLVGLLARLYMKMTLPEVIAAFTVGGAYALGMESSKGVLQPGFCADLIVSGVDWRGLFYQAGYNPILQVLKA